MKSTHFIFDGNKIFISEDLRSVAGFLDGIYKEIESFLSYSRRIEKIKNSYAEVLQFSVFLSEKLKDNSIDFSYNLFNNPEKIVDLFEFQKPIRSEFIVLFANLETLRCLYFAYKYKTSDVKTIIGLARKPSNIDLFIKDFCLNQNNDWVKNNPERAIHIKPEYIRNLRNSLTHFFSVGKDLSIMDSSLDKKSRVLEKRTQFKAKFISTEDLYEILKGSFVLLLELWTNDCNRFLKGEKNNFKEKILCVSSIVDSHAAILVPGSNINLL